MWHMSGVTSETENNLGNIVVSNVLANTDFIIIHRWGINHMHAYLDTHTHTYTTCGSNGNISARGMDTSCHILRGNNDEELY